MAKMPKTEAERLLADVAGEYVFWCHDGRVLRSMRDLQSALASMTEDTFYYHANDDKNDFSNWVKEVIGDSKLAREISRSRTAQQAARYTADRVAFLGAKLA
ncbi:MAG: hypothetical protein DRI39_02670 [Chloroflexi bacterium]|nr:MAG: hypothetical protein DRI39_02670 [Chloroflexota bacterium]